MNTPEEKFKNLVEIIRSLRDPESGCPWDLKQTHQSLRQYMIEEAYEVLAAIDGKQGDLVDELGDVLLQVLLHSQIASDNNNFSIGDVIDSLSNKMIERHPHIFGNGTAQTPEEVEENWNKIKTKDQDSFLDGYSSYLPSLLEAHKIGVRVKKIFDFPSLADARKKMHEEVDELLDAIDTKEDISRVEEELGDLLFTLAQFGRLHGLNAEIALTKANAKFANRFQFMEQNSKIPFEELNRAEKEALWKKAKENEKENSSS